MAIIPHLTGFKCEKCGTTLVRIPEAIANNRIACLDCGAIGDYEQITENGAGLVGGALTPEEIVALRKDMGLSGE